MTETAIAAAVVAMLRSRGYQTWHEVAVEPGGPRADIVARDGAGALWVIETKTRATLALVAQAWRWTAYADASVAVPAGACSASARSVLYGLGLGLLLVHPDGSVEIDPPDPRHPPHGVGAHLLHAALRPEQQASVAGNAAGEYLTPREAQLLRLRELVAAEPGVSLERALARLVRTRGEAAPDARELRRMLRKGLVQGVVAFALTERGKRRTTLYPAEEVF